MSPGRWTLFQQNNEVVGAKLNSLWWLFHFPSIKR